MDSKAAFSAGALLCGVAVGLGAMGSHWLKSKGTSQKDLDTWEIAVKYQFYHAIGLLVLSQSRHNIPMVNLLLTAGVGIFSGSLYTLVLTNQRWLGAITPIGGFAMMAGWGLLFWKTL